MSYRIRIYVGLKHKITTAKIGETKESECIKFLALCEKLNTPFSKLRTLVNRHSKT